MEPRVTDEKGYFHFDNVVDGYVNIQAGKGEYIFQQYTIKTGVSDVRLVSPKHPVQRSDDGKRNDSLCDLEVILVNELTQERIHYEKSKITITPENGVEISLKADDEGRYRTRLVEGKYLVDAYGYPAYGYIKDVEVDVKTGSEKIVTIGLNKEPVIEGVIHFPEGVKPDDIEVAIEPVMHLSIYPADFKVAADGEFSCKVTLGEKAPPQGWLWIHTKDWKFLAWTKVPLDDTRLEITLEPEAIIKFKKVKKHTSFSWDWRQEEDGRKHYGYTKPQKKYYIVDDGEYIGLRGLVANQEGFSYSLKFVNLRKPIVIKSEDLEPGETKIITIPSSSK